MNIQATCYERIVEGDVWTRRVKATRLWPCPPEGSEPESVEPSDDRWVVLQAVGIVYAWDPKTAQWVLARDLDLETVSMTKDEALKLLETVEPASS